MTIRSSHGARHSRWQKHAVWLVPFVGVMITAAATFSALRNIEKIARQDFLVSCDELRTAIANRLNDHARILRSGAAFFNALDTVTRERWRIFNKEQNIDKQLPGIQGIGFALLIPRDALDRHIAEIRNEGFPEYKVRPDGDRETYSSIIYLEPFSGRNLRAFGYDMFSEPVRRKAMEQARDTAAAALSGKVVLVQETDKDVQAGTLMYFPVYRKGLPADSTDERRAALYGWVYSPYRMNDLIRGIIGTRLQEKGQRLVLQVFDGDRIQPQSLLFEDGPAKRISAGTRFTRQIPVDFNGQQWTLFFTQLGGGVLSAEYGIVWLTLASGILMSVLLSLLILALVNTRAAAMRMAEELTEDLSKSEAVLRQTTDRLMLAARAGGVGVWDYDVRDNRLSWDNEMYRLYGITAGQFGGAYEAWQSGLHPDDRKRGDEEIHRALRGEKEFDTEFRVIWPDGTIHNIRALAVVQRDTAGRPLHMIGTNWDITHQKHNEERLEQALLVKSHFISTVSHELRTPLASIKTSVDVLNTEDPGPLTPDQKTFLERVRLSVDRLARLVNNVLDLSKLESGKMVMNGSLFLPGGVVKEVVEMQRMVIKDKPVTLRMEIEDALPELFADKDRLTQVLNNLIGNALKFTQEGTVTVSVSRDNRHTMRFTVSDTGPGISPEDLPRLFQKFQQVGPASQQVSGTGLGLAISKEIVESHGGRIWAEACPGKGSVFIFTLPVKEAGDDKRLSKPVDQKEFSLKERQNDQISEDPDH